MAGSSYSDVGSDEVIKVEENYVDIEEQNQFLGEEDTDDSFSTWEMDNRTYDELFKKFIECQEELRVTKSELNLSKKENMMLKLGVDLSDGELYIVREELKMKMEELENQKRVSEEENFKLKIQIEESEKQLGNVQKELNLKEDLLLKHIDNSNTCIKKHVENIANLKKKLVVNSLEFDELHYQIQQLQDMVKIHEANETKHELEVERLKSEMHDSQAQFCLEKDELYFDIASLSENFERRNKELETKLKQYEAEKLKQEELHATQQMMLQDENRYLKVELDQRKEDFEAVNKELESVTIERDHANENADGFMEFIRSKDCQIARMLNYIREQKAEVDELELNKITTEKRLNSLVVRVMNLENETAEQKVVISDMAEAKKEAIRQLCLSIEHYRILYRELVSEITRPRRCISHLAL